MDFFEAAIAIVAIVFGYLIIQQLVKAKVKGGSSKQLEERVAAIEERLESLGDASLEQRVQVLEKLATDPKQNLKEEIDNLA